MMKNYLLSLILKRLLLLVAVFAFVVLVKQQVLVSPSHPENIGENGDPAVRAKSYGITFPVAELGNCGSYYECRNFCEDPVNASTCLDFGKKRGLYKDMDDTKKKEEILVRAKQELGCDSESSCRTFCSDQANFDKCDGFAKKRGLRGGRIDDPGKTQVIARAKEALGCDSATGCQALCSEEKNRQKCSEFAKTVGLRGGEQHVGPGGCTSEDTCKAFCSDPNNFSVCRGFSSGMGGKFAGPGGCNSEQSCRDYCQGNPDSCRNFAAQSSSGDTYKKYCEENPDKCRQDQEGDKREFEKFCLKNPEKCRGIEEQHRDKGYDPKEMCSRTLNCKWEENTCQCGFYGSPDTDKNRAEEYAKFCRENPDKCRPGQRGGFDNEQERKDFEDKCRENPERCRPYATSYPDSTYYPRQTSYPQNTYYPQATYSPAATAYPAQTYSPSNMSRETQEAGCRGCGGTCSWSGDMCNCQCANSGSSGGSTSTPAPAQTSAPAPQPTQESQPQQTQQPAPVPSAEVHGISAVRNIFDRILDPFR